MSTREQFNHIVRKTLDYLVEQTHAVQAEGDDVFRSIPYICVKCGRKRSASGLTAVRLEDIGQLLDHLRIPYHSPQLFLGIKLWNCSTARVNITASATEVFILHIRS